MGTRGAAGEHRGGRRSRRPQGSDYRRRAISAPGPGGFPSKT
jgi:hypothetical protein